MSKRLISIGIAVVCIGAVAALNISSQTKKSTKSKATTTMAAPAPAPQSEPPIRGPKIKEGQSQAEKAAKVLGEIMGSPDKGIPSDLLDKAQCVLVFPSVVKGGFIVGGQGGRGVASCRLS